MLESPVTKAGSGLTEGRPREKGRGGPCECLKDKGEYKVNQKHGAGWIRILLPILVLAAAAAVYYVMRAGSYKERFLEGTIINGIHAGNMTADEVEERIRSRVENYHLALHFPDGSIEYLSMEDMGFRYTSDHTVSKLLQDQNGYAWAEGILGKTTHFTASEAWSFDEKKLKAAIEALPEMDEKRQEAPVNAHMQMGENQRLMIVPESDGSRINGKVLLEAASKAVREGRTDLIVEETGACSKAKVRANDPELVMAVSDLNTYLDTTITYEMYDGTKLVLDGSKLSRWLKEKKDGSYSLDEETLWEKCRAYVEKIAKKYEDVHDSLAFESSWQGTVYFDISPYGHSIDTEAETRKLYGEILSRRSDDRAPVYSLNRTVDPTFGGTYVEVDIDAQHAFYYEEGELVWDSACVTGTATDYSRATPTGIYDIYDKERNRMLVGEGNSYQSFVNFWMPFNEGVGLHDASWRGSFGGDIYLYSGSHGCVNLPYSSAASLYEMVEIGTPVLVL